MSDRNISTSLLLAVLVISHLILPNIIEAMSLLPYADGILGECLTAGNYDELQQIGGHSGQFGQYARDDLSTVFLNRTARKPSSSFALNCCQYHWNYNILMGSEYSVSSPSVCGGMKGGCNDYLITSPLTLPRKRGGKDNYTANYIPPSSIYGINGALTAAPPDSAKSFISHQSNIASQYLVPAAITIGAGLIVYLIYATRGR